MKIRNYTPKDSSQLLQIMQSNTPKYFTVEELTLFENYLKKDSEHFFILEDEGEIRAGAGVNFGMFEDAGLLSWGMVHNDFHGKKYGTELLKHRLKFIKETTDFKKVIVRTSQLVDAFFNKFHFKETLRTENFWGDGLDLVQMEYHFIENDFFL